MAASERFGRRAIRPEKELLVADQDDGYTLCSHSYRSMYSCKGYNCNNKLVLCIRNEYTVLRCVSDRSYAGEATAWPSVVINALYR